MLRCVLSNFRCAVSYMSNNTRCMKYMYTQVVGMLRGSDGKVMCGGVDLAIEQSCFVPPTVVVRLNNFINIYLYIYHCSILTIPLRICRVVCLMKLLLFQIYMCIYHQVPHAHK